MKRYVASKTALAAECQTTRQTIYALARTHGCPKPRADGRFYVPDWIRFLNRIKHVAKTNEKDQLQVALLDLKVQRASRELVQFEEQLREEITKEVKKHCLRAIEIFAIALDRLPGECAPILSGLSPNEIRRELKARLDLIRVKAAADIRGPAKQNEPQQSVIVPFEKKVATV